MENGPLILAGPLCRSLSFCLSVLWTESVLVREMSRIKQKLTGNKRIRLNADDDDHDNLVVD